MSSIAHVELEHILSDGTEIFTLDLWSEQTLELHRFRLEVFEGEPFLCERIERGEESVDPEMVVKRG